MSNEIWKIWKINITIDNIDCPYSGYDRHHSYANCHYEADNKKCSKDICPFCVNQPVKEAEETVQKI